MKLSIITINYNNALGLVQTLESVRMQSFADFEHVIVDGGSTDGSAGIIKHYAEEVPYVVNWVSEKDKGIYNAMNKGIGMARGEYLQFLNSGDCLVDTGVIKSVFRNDIVEDIVYGGMLMINGSEKKLIEYPAPEDVDFRYCVEYSLPHGASFIRRKCFDVVGLYNEENKIISDWEWFLLSINRYNLSLRQLDILVLRFDGTGISSINENKVLIQEEGKRALQKHFPRMIPVLEKLRKMEGELNEIKRNVIYRIVRKVYTYYRMWAAK